MKNILKQIYLTFVAALLASSAHATIIIGCGTDSDNLDSPFDGVNHVLLKSNEADYSCETINRRFNVTISGVGLGLFGASQEGFILTCPNVRAKAIGRTTFINRKGEEKKGIIEFYGLKAEAAALMGATGAVFANKNGGLCVLTGIDVLGFGAAIVGAKLEIEECEMAYHGRHEYCRSINH